MKVHAKFYIVRVNIHGVIDILLLHVNILDIGQFPVRSKWTKMDMMELTISEGLSNEPILHQFVSV